MCVKLESVSFEGMQEQTKNTVFEKVIYELIW